MSKEEITSEVQISGKRNNFKSIIIRNIPVHIIEKMNVIKEKEGLGYSHQIRRALRCWFENN